MLSLVVGVLLTGGIAPIVWLLGANRRLRSELLESRQRFSSLLDLAPFCAYLKNADGRYLYVNKALAAHAKRAWPDMVSFIGMTDQQLFPTPEGKTYVADDLKVMQCGVPLAFSNTSQEADGTIRHWSTVKFPWVDDQGRNGVGGVSIDISETQQAREAARASEDRCALALEAGRMGTMTLDLRTGTVETCAFFAALHGRPKSKTRLALDESLAELHPDDRPRVSEAIEAALRSQAASSMKYRVVHPDGRIAWIMFKGQIYLDHSGLPSLIRGVGYDITDRQLAEEEIIQRRDMMGRLIQVQENERQMLCHELHDGMMQYSIGAKMLLESTQEVLDPAEQRNRVAASVALLSRGIEEVRHLIRGVRSAVLDDLGLVAAIEDLVEQMGSSGVTIETKLAPDVDGIPAAARTTLYRIVQESLSNIRKHAGATHAVVTIECSPSEARLSVSDDGVGFDPVEGRRRGFGLLGMIERVRLAGGACSIQSRLGRGTCVEVRIPLAVTAVATVDG
jgi:PAS domain S-box-containing protein